MADDDAAADFPKSSEGGASPSAPGAAPPCPEPWVAVWSKSQQRYYYFNKETRETRWNLPRPEEVVKEFASPAPEQRGGASPSTPSVAPSAPPETNGRVPAAGPAAHGGASPGSGKANRFLTESTTGDIATPKDSAGQQALVTTLKSSTSALQEVFGDLRSTLPFFCCTQGPSDDGDVIAVVDHEAPRDGRVFEVTLQTQPGCKFGLGMDYHPDRQVLPIRDIEGHLIEDWNRSNPSRKVVPGDRVVCINGVRDRADDMMDALRATARESQRVTLGIVRFENWQVLQDEEFITAYDSRPPEPATLGGFGAPIDRHAHSSWPGESTGYTVGTVAEGAEDAPLPEPWVAVWSKSQQKYYYFNKQTKQSRWTRPPPEAVVTASSMPPPPEKPPAEKQQGAMTHAEASRDLPKPWQAVWSKSRMRYYYYDPTTNLAVWTKPKVASIKSSGGKAMDFEKADKLVGNWRYESGSYTISWHKGSLVYKESKPGIFAVYGIFVQHGDWMEAELLDQVKGDTPVPPQEMSMVRGMLRCRLKSTGQSLTNFQVWGADAWEADVLANKAQELAGQ